MALTTKGATLYAEVTAFTPGNKHLSTKGSIDGLRDEVLTNQCPNGALGGLHILRKSGEGIGSQVFYYADTDSHSELSPRQQLQTMASSTSEEEFYWTQITGWARQHPFTYCDERFSDLYALDEHWRNTHRHQGQSTIGNWTTKRELSPPHLSSQQLFMSHYPTHAEYMKAVAHWASQAPFTCCKKKFSNVYNLYEHLNSSPKRKGPEDQEMMQVLRKFISRCKTEESYTEGGIYIQEYRYPAELLFRCCNKTFHTQGDIDRHLRDARVHRENRKEFVKSTQRPRVHGNHTFTALGFRFTQHNGFGDRIHYNDYGNSSDCMNSRVNCEAERSDFDCRPPVDMW